MAKFALIGVIALLFLAFFWNPVVALMGLLALLLVWGIMGMVK